MRKKLQNNKGYAESPEFLPSLQFEVNLIPSSLDYNFFVHTHTHTHTHIYIYMDTNPIPLPCSLAHVSKRRGSRVKCMYSPTVGR